MTDAKKIIKREQDKARWLANPDAIRLRNRESYRRNKEKTLQRQRECYAANKEKVANRVFEYHKKNPEVQKRASRNYYKKNAAQIKETTKAYQIKTGNAAQKAFYHRNKTQILSGNRLKRIADPERFSRYDRDWRKRNPQRTAAIEFSKHAKRRLLESASKEAVKIISAFVERAKAKEFVICYWCKNTVSGKKCQLDHIVALSAGGKHSIDNICVSCKSCNLSKGKKSLPEWNMHKTNPQLFLL